MIFYSWGEHHLDKILLSCVNGSKILEKQIKMHWLFFSVSDHITITKWKIQSYFQSHVAYLHRILFFIKKICHVPTFYVKLKMSVHALIMQDLNFNEENILLSSRFTTYTTTLFMTIYFWIFSNFLFAGGNISLEISEASIFFW